MQGDGHVEHRHRGGERGRRSAGVRQGAEDGDHQGLGPGAGDEEGQLERAEHPHQAEHAGGHDAGGEQGHQDPAEQPEVVGAEDPRGVLDVGWDLFDERHGDQDDQRQDRHEVDQDDGEQAAADPQPVHQGRELDRVGQRRKDHRQQREEHDRVAAGEPLARQHVSGGYSDQQGDGDVRDRDLEGDLDRPGQARGVPCLAEPGEGVAVGKPAAAPGGGQGGDDHRGEYGQQRRGEQSTGDPGQDGGGGRSAGAGRSAGGGRGGAVHGQPFPAVAGPLNSRPRMSRTTPRISSSIAVSTTAIAEAWV